MSLVASPAHAQSNGLNASNNSPLSVTTLDGNSYIFGYYELQQGANGSNGITTSNGVTFTNNAGITLNNNAQSYGGAAIWAMDQGGSANGVTSSFSGGTGGSSSGVTINNTNANNGQITATSTGSNGFAAIQGMSVGGNGSGRGSGGSGASSVLNSGFTVTTNWTWLYPGATNTGIWGVMASSQGGQGGGTNTSNSNNNGGSGGPGGPASVNLSKFGDVFITVNGAPTTPNNTSAAVAAISQGGNGGNAVQGNGNSGGQGGSAGLTSITQTDSFIQATGTNLPGLLAYGTGGVGGFAGDPNANSGQLNPSQNGGSGGSTAGAAVNVYASTRNAYIDTTASGLGLSPAIAVVQVGGAGGYGGYSHDKGFSNAHGGNGGNGGNTGAININTAGNGWTVNLTTNGVSSPGIYASSLGGASGYGGSADTVIAGGADGGAAGQGGAGGDISVNLAYTNITTNHSSSPGIVARSEGGIGAAGGLGNADVANGGDGGNGGASGNINITTDSHSTITTTFGVEADGILAQTLSAAGGNGNGVNAAITGNPGSAGVGGAVGTVTITNGATISTQGNDSRGILAQAMAGSGGSGDSSWSIFHAAGGTGGTAGASGTINVTNTGSIKTLGDTAEGVLMQSIGGGGGAGGGASGITSNVGGNGGNATNGGLINFNNSGAINTSGTGAIGVLGQSIGGNGGDGGGASGIAVSIGGSAGSAASGGAITANLNSGSSITTTGDVAHGVVLQSIGGGGGNGGDAFSTGVFASVSIGGSGGSGGGGGSVVVNTNGANILTSGTKSAGLVVQSIGGGGGTGGRAMGTSIGALFDASVAIGGSGGSDPSGGGTATVSMIGGSIATGQSMRSTSGSVGAGVCPGTSVSGACNVQSVDNHGVVVQSIGGGGGLGGSASAQSIALAVPVTPSGGQLDISAAVAVGGSGGAGGDGGLAQFFMSNGAKITTAGAGGAGLLVQSIGGGGGAGGDSSANAASIGFTSDAVPESSKLAGVSITSAIGGKAGGAGNGGAINIGVGATVNSSGNFVFDPSTALPTSIVTYGDYADGIKAQSIGGGGGDGGTGGGNTQDFGTKSTTSLSYNVGGTGSPGGNGGNVTLYVQPGNGIKTWGSAAAGIIAQSIGGGGGTSQGGSYSFSQSAAPIDNTYKLGYTNNLGNGSGDKGGNGSTVLVSVQAPIVTHGNDATGILAQSIGGGGGLGGSSGEDGSGDNPVVSALEGREFTSDVLNVIKADGGVPPPQSNLLITHSVGGTGGTGGTGGDVTVFLASTIATLGNPVVVGGNQQASSGDWAHGIVAQSIGGGGGKGGSALAQGSADPAELNASLDMSVGGSGGSGGAGGTVTVNLQNGGVIQTVGYGATGIVAQSIGGGGGMGVDGSDAAAGAVSVGRSRSGDGAGGGSGTNVYFYNDAASGSSISTSGMFADGMNLQSIGGGGGLAGAGSSAWLAFGRPQMSATMTYTAGGGKASGGSGGNVTVNPGYANNYPMNINASGYGAYGIVAQSIGGGGGNIVSNQAGTGAPTIQLGSLNTDASASGGSVLVNLTSPSVVNASGIGGIAVLAQSIGGGGGIIRVNEGTNDTPSLTTTNNGSYSGQTSPSNANGGPVQVNSYAQVSANGPGGIGIFAQSVGGGGGLILDGATMYAGAPLQQNKNCTTSACGGISTNGSQTFLINILGNSVSATGVNGVGIFAQAAGYGQVASGTPNIFVGNGDPTNTVTVTGGSGSGAGIWIDRPNGSTDNNQGFINVQQGGVLTTSAGSGGTAINTTGGGATSVINSGKVTGNVYLNDGQNNLGGSWTPSAMGSDGRLQNDRGALLNKSTGTWVPGAQARADVLNQGTILFDNAAMTTHLNGHFIQTSEGRLSPLIDSLNGTASLLQIDGSAAVDGLIAPNAVSLLPGTTTVLTAGTLVSAPVQARDSLLFDWDAKASGNTIKLTPRATFAPVGTSLTSSQSSLASYYDRAWNGSDASMAKLFAGLSRINESGDYKSALDSLSAKATHAQSMAMINSASSILGTSMSCPVFTSQNSMMTEDNCVWGQVNGRWTDQSGSGDTQGYHVTGTTYRFGAQHQFAPEWYLGGALAGGYTHSQSKGGSSGNGTTYDGSVTLKRVTGPWQFAGSFALSQGSFDVDRNINFDGLNQKIKSKPDALLAGFKFRTAYEFTRDDWYLKPYGDVDLYYSKLSGFKEGGNTPYALRVRSADKTNVALTPMLELGRRVDLDAKTSLRAYAALGVSYRPNASYTIKSSFANANSSSGTFDDHLKSPEVLGKIDVGLQLFRAGGFEAKAGYTADLGSRYNSQTATARFAYHF